MSNIKLNKVKELPQNNQITGVLEISQKKKAKYSCRIQGVANELLQRQTALESLPPNKLELTAKLLSCFGRSTGRVNPSVIDRAIHDADEISRTTEVAVEIRPRNYTVKFSNPKCAITIAYTGNSFQRHGSVSFIEGKKQRKFEIGFDTVLQPKLMAAIVDVIAKLPRDETESLVKNINILSKKTFTGLPPRGGEDPLPIEGFLFNTLAKSTNAEIRDHLKQLAQQEKLHLPGDSYQNYLCRRYKDRDPDEDALSCWAT